MSERNSTADAHSYRAPVNIETARNSALRTFYANTSTRYKKKEGKRGEKKGSVNDSARREIAVVERASDFSRARPRAVDLASLFSLLSWSCTDFPPSSPQDSFPSILFLLANRSRLGRSVSVIHTRFSPRSLAVSSPEAFTCRVKGEFVMHFIALNGCPPVHPAANILFHSIISLTVSSPQSDSSPMLFSLRSTALSLKIRRGGGGGYYRLWRETIFRFRV